MKFILITYQMRYKIRYSNISYEFDRYNKSLIVRYKISIEMSSTLMFRNVFPKCLFSKSHEKYGLCLIELALLKIFQQEVTNRLEKWRQFSIFTRHNPSESLLQDIGKIDVNFLIFEQYVLLMSFSR